MTQNSTGERCTAPSRTCWMLAVLACASVFAFGQAKFEPHATQHEFADEQQTTSNLAVSEDELRHDLISHPDAAPILYRLALVLRQENKPKESLQNPNVHFELGHAYQQVGAMDKAVAQFNLSKSSAASATRIKKTVCGAQQIGCGHEAGK